MSDPCVLCAQTDASVGVALIRYRYPERPFSWGPRCRDRAACRERAEAAGDTWEVVDAAEPLTREAGSHGTFGGGFSREHLRVFEAARAFRERRGETRTPPEASPRAVE